MNCRFLKALIVAAVTIIACAPVASGQLASPPWPTYQHDAQRTGLSEYNVGGGALTQKWFVPNVCGGDPIVGSDGTIYVSGIDGFYAVNPDGIVKWKSTTTQGGALFQSPSLDEAPGLPILGGIIYVGSTYGPLYALSAHDGLAQPSLYWSQNGYSSPAINPSGAIYVSVDGTLHAFSPIGPSEIWSFSADSNNSPPSIGPDGTIYFISIGDLYAVTPYGTPKWIADPGLVSRFNSTVAIATDGTIYAANGYGSLSPGALFVIDSTGTIPTLKWSVATDGAPASPSIGPDGTIFVGDEFIANPQSGITTGSLYAVTPDGTLKWKVPLGGAVTGPPAISADGTIFVSDAPWNDPSQNELRALNYDGTLRLWLPNAGDTSTAIAADGTAYVLFSRRPPCYRQLFCFPDPNRHTKHDAESDCHSDANSDSNCDSDAGRYSSPESSSAGAGLQEFSELRYGQGRKKQSQKRSAHQYREEKGRRDCDLQRSKRIRIQ
jgi:hypothetical protein